MKDGRLLDKVAELWLRLGGYKLNDCKLAILEQVLRLPSAQPNRFPCVTKRPTYSGISVDKQITLPELVMLVVGPQNVLISNLQGTEVDAVKLSLLAGWELDAAGITLVVSKNLMEVRLAFATQQGPLIDLLLKGYTRLLGKKDIKGLAQRKEEWAGRVPYSVRADPERIERQKAEFQLVYDLM